MHLLRCVQCTEILSVDHEALPHDIETGFFSIPNCKNIDKYPIKNFCTAAVFIHRFGLSFL